MLEDDFHKELSNGSKEERPVLPFLPPTEEPSPLALAISVTLVVWLTVAICGNASQIVLQIYTRRLTNKIPPQCFIAFLFFINFMVPMGLPSVILEKLVRVWMFGRLSCHAHHILTTTGRVVVPWSISLLHTFTALFLNRPNRVTRIEGILASLAFASLIFLMIAVVIPQGMSAEVAVIRKDEIDTEQYIMLIHTYRCYVRTGTHPLMTIGKFALEFAVPLLLSILIHMRMNTGTGLKSRRAVSKSLAYILIIHYCCNIFYYIPEVERNTLLTLLPEDTDLQQLLPFLSPTLIWYPLSQLSGAISRCHLDKGEEDRLRARMSGRHIEIEPSHMMSNQVDL